MTCCCGWVARKNWRMRALASSGSMPTIDRITDEIAVYRNLSGETLRLRFFGRPESEDDVHRLIAGRPSRDDSHRARHSGLSCVAAFQGPDSETDL